MRHRNNPKEKINKILNTQQQIDNTIRNKQYQLQEVYNKGEFKNIKYLETDWVKCQKIKTYSNCFSFSFGFYITLNEKLDKFLNVDYAILFKGDVVPYKELINDEENEKDEPVLYGEYNQNLNFIEVPDIGYRAFVTGTGVGIGDEDVYAKIIVAIKPSGEANKFSRYEE